MQHDQSNQFPFMEKVNMDNRVLSRLGKSNPRLSHRETGVNPIITVRNDKLPLKRCQHASLFQSLLPAFIIFCQNKDIGLDRLNQLNRSRRITICSQYVHMQQG